MNEALKILKERRSIRAFRPEPLKKEDLDAIVEAGLYAPSAKNLQSTKLVVVRDAAVLARLERLNSRRGHPFMVRRRPLWCCPTASIPTGFRTALW